MDRVCRKCFPYVGYCISGNSGKGQKKCPECDSEISKKVRICPECGYLFQQGLSEEQLTGYIEQEQEKEMSSEQIDRAFEKTDNIAADEIDSFDGDINDFLQE